MSIIMRQITDCDPSIFDKANEAGIGWRVEGNNVEFETKSDIMPIMVLSVYNNYHLITIYDKDYNRYQLHKNENLNATIIRLRLILGIPA